MIQRTPEATLERAVVNYKARKENPEAVYGLYEAFWDNFRANLERSGMSLSKRDLRTAGFTAEELRLLWYERARDGNIAKKDLFVEQTPVTTEILVARAQQEIPDMPFYLPEVLANQYGLRILGKGFPEMRSWLFAPEIHNVINICVLTGEPELAGWMSIETSLIPPYNNMTRQEAAQIFKDIGRLGQTANIYIAGSAVSNAVEGHYFDEGPYERTRLLGTASWGIWSTGDGFSSESSYRSGFGIGHMPGGLITDWFKEDAKGAKIGFRSAEPMSKKA